MISLISRRPVRIRPPSVCTACQCALPSHASAQLGFPLHANPQSFSTASILRKRLKGQGAPAFKKKGDILGRNRLENKLESPETLKALKELLERKGADDEAGVLAPVKSRNKAADTKDQEAALNEKRTVQIKIAAEVPVVAELAGIQELPAKKKKHKKKTAISTENEGPLNPRSPKSKRKPKTPPAPQSKQEKTTITTENEHSSNPRSPKSKWKPKTPPAPQSEQKKTIDRVVRKVLDTKEVQIRHIMTNGQGAIDISPSSQPYTNAKSKLVFEDIANHITRAGLIKLIQNGSLSPSDNVEAVRKLRSNLISSPKPIPPKTEEKTASAFQTIRKIQTSVSGPSKTESIKQAMQKSARGPEKQSKKYATGPMENGKGFEIRSVTASELKLVPVEKIQDTVPGLSYGLERALFNPGVYHLQDPRSRVFNFDPYLQKIMPIAEFDFNALKPYITSSKDTTLLDIAREENMKYTGSTSSTTAALAHFHFLLSQWRPINSGQISKSFHADFNTFTALQRGPSAVFLRYRDGVYAIDADKQYDTPNILAMLGKSMEKLLTLPKEDYEKYRIENSDQLSEKDRTEAESFHYTTIGDFLLRSQLDAYDPRLPGTGMFDLKTRAVVSIRMDVQGYEEGMGYEVKGRFGQWESYEREYFDMIRAAFLKYSLQVRMGRMDGIFVAFHNIERLFGFQYISLSEMDYALHGTTDTTTGDAEFKLSLDLLNKVLDRATEKYPEKSLRLHFETRETGTPFMYVFAEPMEEEQINEIQNSNLAKIKEFEKDMLGLKSGEESAAGKNEEWESLEEKKLAEWKDLRSRVEESIEKDELDIQEIRQIAQNMLEESEYWDDLSPKERERCIESLVNSATVDGNAEDREDGETVPVDQVDGDGEEDGEETFLDETDDDEHDEAEEDGNTEEQDGEEEDEEEEEGVEQEDSEDQEDEETKSNTQLEEVAEDTQHPPREIFVEKIEKNTDAPVLDDSELEESGQINKSELWHASEETLLDNPATPEAVEDVMEENFETAADEEDVNNSNSGESEVAESDQINSDAESASDTSYGSAEGEVEKTKDLLLVPSTAVEELKTDPETELLAMTLTIRNKVNNNYVERPINLHPGSQWTVEYALAEVESKSRATLLYEACKRRRHIALDSTTKDMAERDTWNKAYIENLKRLSREGREWRAKTDREDAEMGQIKVLDLVTRKASEETPNENGKED